MIFILSKIKNLNFMPGTNMHHCAKCNKNRSKGCRYMVIQLFFKMAGVRHLGFLKFNFLTVWEVERPTLHQRTKFRKDRSNRCGDIAIFVIFKCRPPPCWISKIRNFYGRSLVGDQYVSLCQISSKPVTRLQRYGDFTVFKMAAVRHLGFLKIEFFNGRSG